MSEQTNSETWARLLALMEEKMQFGFLEQARFVVQVQFRGTEAHLKVCSQDALDFFSAQVNQQRLMIISRPVVAIDTFQVELVEAEPLK